MTDQMRASRASGWEADEFVSDHTREVITSERYARSKWGDKAQWCGACNGWVLETRPEGDQ